MVDVDLMGWAEVLRSMTLAGKAIAFGDLRGGIFAGIGVVM